MGAEVRKPGIRKYGGAISASSDAPFRNPHRPPNGYVSMVLREGYFQVSALNGRRHDFTLPYNVGAPATEVVLPLFSRLDAIDPDTHWRTVGAAGLNGDGRDIAAQTWHRRGISTMLVAGDSTTDNTVVLEQVMQHHSPFGIRQIEIGPDGRVFSSRLGKWTDYKPFYTESAWTENTGIILNVAKASTNTVFIDDNTTEKAGGVAGMNHPKQRFIDDFNETERQKIANGEAGYPIDYRWMKKDGRIDQAIAAKYGVDLQDPELLAQYGEIDPQDPQQKKLNIFKLTKKRHVMLQNDCEPDATYTAKDDALYHAWSETQYQLNLRPVLMEAKAQGKQVSLKLEDQQTWGQLAALRADFPLDDPDSAFLKIIARNHIHSRAALGADPSSKQYPIVQSILGDLTHGVDLFMVHRSNDQAGRDEFVFRGPDGNVHPVIAGKVAYAEASFDEMDGLGRPITAEERPFLYAENNYNLYESGQTPDNFDLPGIGIYARDDESKDKITGMLAYARFAEMMLRDGVPIEQIPNYRDIAMGATDDPSGDRIHAAYLIGLHPELEATISKEIQDSFTGGDKSVIERLQAMVAEMPWVADKIKKYRFTYDKYDDRNRRSIEETCEVAGQFSTAEACEDQISRWIAGGPDGGVYTVVSNVGGMPPQVEDGVSGKIIDKTGDMREIDAIAREFYGYFTEIYPNSERRAAFRQRVKASLKPQYTTLYNIAREFGAGALASHRSDRIPEMVRQHRERTGHFPFVHDLLGEYKPEQQSVLVGGGGMDIAMPNLNFVAKETQVFPL